MGAAVSPDRTEVAYVFTPRDDLNRSEIRIAAVATGAVRAVTGTPRMQDRAPAWSPDGATLAYVVGALGRWALHTVARDGSGDRQLTDRRRRLRRAGLASGRRPRRGDARRAQPLRPRVVDVASGELTELAPGGVWGAPQWTASGARRRHLRGPRDAPGAAASSTAPRRGTLLAPAPAPSAARRTPRPSTVTFPSRDGLEIPACLFRPRRDTSTPVPAIVYPHGGPTDAYMDAWDGHLQYFVDKGYAWLAVNFRGSTGYGRDFERANHDVWGVKDTWDCLAAADHLRTLDWVDGDRLGIFGASYGSYMSLLLGHRRPRAPLPLRGRQVRRLRHPHVVGAGRPRGRAGPRADDGPPGHQPGRLPRGLARPSHRADRGADPRSRTASATSA